jgi:excisionase family DNA binding protein
MKKALGTHEIAAICQVTPPTVGRWLEEGRLPYFTTGGGHRRVWCSDLAAFLLKHNIPIPDALRETSPLRILIVDDDPQALKLFRVAVGTLYPSAEIHEARDGFEAGHKTIRVMPTLLILDILLPGLDGYRICRMIREDATLRHVKILAVSGHEPESTRPQAIAAGADDFVAKPFQLDLLKRAIDALVADSRSAPRVEAPPDAGTRGGIPTPSDFLGA